MTSFKFSALALVVSANVLFGGERVTFEKSQGFAAGKVKDNPALETSDGDFEVVEGASPEGTAHLSFLGLRETSVGLLWRKPAVHEIEVTSTFFLKAPSVADPGDRDFLLIGGAALGIGRSKAGLEVTHSLDADGTRVREALVPEGALARYAREAGLPDGWVEVSIRHFLATRTWSLVISGRHLGSGIPMAANLSPNVDSLVVAGLGPIGLDDVRSDSVSGVFQEPRLDATKPGSGADNGGPGDPSISKLKSVQPVSEKLSKKPGPGGPSVEELSKDRKREDRVRPIELFVSGT